MGKIAVVLICFFRVFAQSYPCCPQTFGTALVIQYEFMKVTKSLQRSFRNDQQHWDIWAEAKQVLGQNDQPDNSSSRRRNKVRI